MERSVSLTSKELDWNWQTHMRQDFRVASVMIFTALVLFITRSEIKESKKM